MNTPAAPARVGRAKPLTPDERRESILDATVPLIMSRGADLTTREIADAAGVAEGTLFRVFDDKQAILDAAVARFLDPTPTLEALRAIDPALTLEDKIIRIVDILRTRFAGVTGILAALGLRDAPASLKRGTSPRSPEGRAAAAAALEPHRAELRMEPEQVVHTIRLLCFAASLPPMGGIRETTNQEIADVVLHGVLARES